MRPWNGSIISVSSLTMLLGGVELAALLAFGTGELAEEVFVDAAEGVEVHAGRDLGDLLEQLLEQRAGEKVVGLGQHAGELRVVLLDRAHGRVDPGADVGGLGQRQQMVIARFGSEIEHALGVIGRGLVYAATTARRGACLLQLGALRRKADIGEAEKDQPEDGAGIFLGLQPGIRAKLIGGVPEALLERCCGGVFFGARDPAQRNFSSRLCRAKTGAAGRDQRIAPHSATGTLHCALGRSALNEHGAQKSDFPGIGRRRLYSVLHSCFKQSGRGLGPSRALPASGCQGCDASGPYSRATPAARTAPGCPSQ
jgi:hypothetical protein